jgi:hypothetical protein
MGFLSRFGGTVSVAMIAALLAAMPATLRMREGGVDLLPAWLTLGGLAIAPMLLLIPLTRLAREGLRSVSQQAGESRALERTAAAMVFAGTWLWFLSALGAQLREKTHHRALGAVTFAIGAAVALVAIALVARRLAVILTTLREKRRAIGTGVALAAIVLSAAVLALRVARGAPALDEGARAMLVDGLAFALALAFFARKTFEERLIVPRVGPPAAFCILVVAMHTLGTSQTALRALEQLCPLHFAILSGFARLAI